MPKRTTLTLDDDVSAGLELEARRSGESFRETVNRVIRRGLHPPEASRPGKRFRIKARDLGLRSGLSYDSIEDLLDQIEGPARR